MAEDEGPAGSGLNERYRAHLHVLRPEIPFHESAGEVPGSAVRARVGRTGKAFPRLASRTRLRELEATNVDQPMLEEICRLERLEYLDLGWPLVATDLTPLTALKSLRHLKIDSPRKIADFSPVAALPLTHLFISSAKSLASLEVLAPLRDRLVALGIEGGMYSKQTIESLWPLEGFALEALFLTSTVLSDQDLRPIATMPNIRFLGTAINAPRAQFFALAEARPGLECQWFEPRPWANFRDPRPPKGSPSPRAPAANPRAT